MRCEYLQDFLERRFLVYLETKTDVKMFRSAMHEFGMCDKVHRHLNKTAIPSLIKALKQRKIKRIILRIKESAICILVIKLPSFCKIFYNFIFIISASGSCFHARNLYACLCLSARQHKTEVKNIKRINTKFVALMDNAQGQIN